MLSVRQEYESQERNTLCSLGVPSAESAGRLTYEEPCQVRTCFQRDVDRITYCKAFRRLMHKTQVFLQPEGDHYRTRLTHTLEVSRIARTISRALRLNEDLTEAIALGHDLGHTPFGHEGERTLADIYSLGFVHAEQSLRVVDRIEKSGQGLNLSYETRMGILHHTVGADDDTLEARVVRISDRVAYINHDADDAVRAGILSEAHLPSCVLETLGDRKSLRIDTIVRDIIHESHGNNDIKMSQSVSRAVNEFRGFMFEKVYQNSVAKREETKVYGILSRIFDYYTINPQKLPSDYLALVEQDGLERVVCDYVSGMTDKYAIYKYGELFIPEVWQVR